MLPSQDLDDKFDKLRRQAEELIRQERPMAVPAPEDILELIHELKIHQAELEIQNEELKRAQQELADLHRQYERLYEFAPCGYVTLNPQGMITRVNLTAVALLGVAKQHLLQSDLNRHIAPAWQDAFLEARRDSARTGEKQHVELQLKIKTGPPLWVRADITADRDESGAALQWRVVLMDISQEKEAAAQIRKLNETLEQRVAERTAELARRSDQIQRLALDLSQAEDREWKRFAAVLHDDFQQQLAYIKLELAQMKHRADADMGQQLGRLGQLLADCIQKMRHLSYEVNPPSLHRSGLLAALIVLAKDMQEHHGLLVTLHAQPGAEPDTLPLASMLYRSVRELLLNVVKHAGVKTAVVDVRSQDKRIRIKVTDKGKGFDYPAVRARQGCEPGFGLYNIEDRMLFLGGTMRVATSPGKGSSIVLTVPHEISPKSVATETGAGSTIGKKSTASGPDGPFICLSDEKQIRLLLVEDHKLMREALADMLKDHKELAVVGKAADGLGAIKLASRLKPDVILMDVTMPDLDGIEATTRITRDHPEISIIGLSMHNDDDTRHRMLAAGATAFLAKTESPDKLLKTIRRVHRDSRSKKHI